MKKLSMLAGAFLALTISGCGSDTREVLAKNAEETLKKTANTLASIKESVEKLDNVKTDDEKKDLLKKAGDSAASLRKNAQDLQRIRQESLLMDKPTAEQLDELRKNFREPLAKAVERVKKEQEKLNQALRGAEQRHPQQKSGLTDLKQKLQLAQGEFEPLIKQQ